MKKTLELTQDQIQSLFRITCVHIATTDNLIRSVLADGATEEGISILRQDLLESNELAAELQRALRDQVKELNQREKALCHQTIGHDWNGAGVITAVKEVRYRLGDRSFGLKEAKELVDAYMVEQGWMVLSSEREWPVKNPQYWTVTGAAV